MMIPERFAPHVYSIFRAVFGFLFMLHGLQKMFGMFGGRVAAQPSLVGTAGVIELVAGALIMVGLFTKPLAFLASGQMAVAYFRSHFPRGDWPVENGGEPSVLFCFAFLYIATRGAGLLSLDAARRRLK